MVVAVRFADQPTVEVEVFVEAPPAKVWELVSDIDLPSRFSEEFQGAEWLDDAGPALGSRFQGRNKHEAIGEWQTVSTIVGFEPERVFEWAVGDPANPSASWRFELAPQGSGTLLKQWSRMGPGPSGLTMAIERMPDKEERIIERRCEHHRENMTRTLEGIKGLAEGRS